MKISIIQSNSKGNLILISENNKILILEAGLPIEFIYKTIKNFSLRKVMAMFISHQHKDHYKYLYDYLNFNIPVYLPNGFKLDKLKLDFKNNLHFIKNQQIIKINDKLKIRPFDLHHDIENFGFLIHWNNKKIVFITDTSFCKYKFTGIDYFLIECNFDDNLLKNSDFPYKDRIIKSHFSVNKLKEFLLKQDLSKTKIIYLLHCSSNHLDKERALKEIKQEIRKINNKIKIFI